MRITTSFVTVSVVMAIVMTPAMGVTPSPAGQPPAPLDCGKGVKLQPSRLENLIQVSHRIYTGGEPIDAAAFGEIRQRGIGTVVSVDGIRPDVELATQLGLRYVHIPMGYGRVSEWVGNSLARLVREVDGPIYIHCHHGRHRGPAAAAIACMADDKIDASTAVKILKLAGTNPRYAGLFQSVREYQPPEPGEQLPPLVSVAAVDSLSTRMAAIDRIFERLATRSQGTASAGGVPHRDVHDAFLLEEAFREIRRTMSHGARDEARQQQVPSELYSAAEKAARQLKVILSDGRPDLAARALEQLEQKCIDCHTAHRD